MKRIINNYWKYLYFNSGSMEFGWSSQYFNDNFLGYKFVCKFNGDGRSFSLQLNNISKIY